jgi:hypothetical protein
MIIFYCNKIIDMTLLKRAIGSIYEISTDTVMIITDNEQWTQISAGANWAVESYLYSAGDFILRVTLIPLQQDIGERYSELEFCILLSKLLPYNMLIADPEHSNPYTYILVSQNGERKQVYVDARLMDAEESGLKIATYRDDI